MKLTEIGMKYGQVGGGLPGGVVRVLHRVLPHTGDEPKSHTQP